MTFYDVFLDSTDNLDYLLEKSNFNIKINDNIHIIDLRNNNPSSLSNYELLGSTANCLASLIEYDIPNFKCSRMFIYYNERLDTDTYNLNNSIKNLLKYGFCNDKDYLYDSNKINEKPPDEVYEKANEFRFKFEFMKIKKSLNSFCGSLINNEPIIISIAIYDNFDINNTFITLPSLSNKKQGGITIIIYGFNMQKQIFIIQLFNKYYEIPFFYILSNEYSSTPYIFMMRTYINFKELIIDDNKTIQTNDINNNLINSYIDLRPKFNEVYDQGKIGSCTANALCSIYEYDTTNFKGSRLFLYYNERKLINETDKDNGAYLSDGIICLKTFGLCEEKDWSYIIENLFKEPSSIAFEKAKKNYVIEAKEIDNNIQIIKYWINKNEPIALGIALYSNFNNFSSAKTGKIGLPKTTDKFIGGHAVILCGFDDFNQEFILRNSWGSYWGDKGYFYLPYSYITNKNLCSDLWIITKIRRL